MITIILIFFTWIGLIIFNKNHNSNQKNDLAKKREKANIARTFLLSSVDPCLLIAILFDWISFWDNPDKKIPFDLQYRKIAFVSWIFCFSISYETILIINGIS
jgi:hypothetical protein